MVCLHNMGQTYIYSNEINEIGSLLNSTHKHEMHID